MLGGLALKWRWRQRREAAGLSTDKPNLVTGSNVQVCWEKFCRYWDVEPRQVPVGPDVTHLTPEGAAAHCDENTIGVVAVLGSTFDGAYEPVAGIAGALDALAANGGPDVPIHVDAASGGFVAPFVDPDLEWDFRVPRVQSVNASGHKYGLVYPGVGWIIWRDHDALPKDSCSTWTTWVGTCRLSPSISPGRARQVVAQYYMFLRLGREGYRRVQEVLQHGQLDSPRGRRMEQFALVSKGGPGFRSSRSRSTETAPTRVYDLSEGLRIRGWLVPAYPMPPDLQDISVLRVVVRNGLSRDMAGMLVNDLKSAVAGSSTEVACRPRPPRIHRRVSTTRFLGSQAASMSVWLIQVVYISA